MRICGGQFRGRKLNTPTGDHIRPTSDKVRQALFNMLDSRGFIQDSIVLDGFCGTGALGLEALSRGAQRGIFIDKDKRSLKICAQNIEMLKVSEKSHMYSRDTTVLTENTAGHVADLVFLDPPYNKGMIPLALSALTDGCWLAKDAVIVLESERDLSCDLSGYSLIQEKTYKDTMVIILQKDAL